MSYRDPKIIVDRSAEIYAQGANQLGQAAVGLVEKKYAEQAARNEAWKKKVDASGLSQQQEKDKANIAIAEMVGELPPNLSDIAMDKFIKVSNDLIERNADQALNSGKYTTEDKQDLQKDIIKSKVEIKRYKDFAADTLADNEEVEAQPNIGGPGSNYVYSGYTGEEQLATQLRSKSWRGVINLGARTEAIPSKNANGDEQITYTTKLDSKDRTSRKLIEAYGLKVNEKGIATVTSIGGLELEPTLTHVPSDFEATEIKGLEGLFKADGSLEDVAYFSQTEYSDKEVLGGKAIERSSSSIFDEGKYLESAQSAYDDFAADILGNPPAEQFAFLQGRLGNPIEFKDWDLKTPSERETYISNKVKENDLKARKASMWSRVATVEEKGAGKAAEDGMIYYKSKPTSLKDLEPQGPTESTLSYFEQPEIVAETNNINSRLDGSFNFEESSLQSFQLIRQGDHGNTRKRTYFYNKIEDGKIIISTDKKEIQAGKAPPRNTFDPNLDKDVKRAKKEFGIVLIPTF